MKTMLKTLTATLALAGSLSLQPAAAANLCLDTRDIASSTSKDGKVLVFKMKDGRILVNRLRGYCPNLKFSGFVWKLPTGTSQACENESTLTTLAGAQTCTLGKFTPS